MSHCKPGSIKTDASWKDIWHIMLEYVRQKAPLKNAPKPETAGYGIMSKGSAHKVGKENDPTTETAIAITEPLNGESKEASENRVNVGEDVPSTEAAIEARPSYLGVNFEVNFDEKLGKDHDRGKRVRYQLAPRENWGPMSRAK
jgi:tRNA (guanine26-N2/guanine27-N2)-dimethyltransferase